MGERLTNGFRQEARRPRWAGGRGRCAWLTLTNKRSASIMHVRHHSCGQESRAHSRGLHNGARPTGKTEQVRLRARGAAPRLGGGAERGRGKEAQLSRGRGEAMRQQGSAGQARCSDRAWRSLSPRRALVGHVDHLGFESIFRRLEKVRVETHYKIRASGLRQAQA